MVRKLLADSGLRLLHNETETVRVNRHLPRFSGVGDLWNSEVDPEAAFAVDSPAKVPTILLAHNPDTKELVADHAWDLMLCGHTHGGQVLLPGVGTRFVRSEERRVG